MRCKILEKTRRNQRKKGMETQKSGATQLCTCKKENENQDLKARSGEERSQEEYWTGRQIRRKTP